MPFASSSSVRDFCERHGISKPTFDRARRRGETPTIIRIGRQLRITDADELAWLERKRAEAKGQAA